MNKTIIKKYVELIVDSGIALKKGQSVVIGANVDQEAFVAMLVEECYKKGAKHVHINWNSQKIALVKNRKAKLADLCDILPMERAYQQWATDELPCFIWIDSDDPDGGKKLDPKKVAAVRRAKYAAFEELIEKRENHYQWCIAGVPSPAWAKKVFPGLPKGKAMEKMWEAILLTSRALDGNGIANWEVHSSNLKKRCEYLNNLHLASLHYTSSNGTDLTIGLIPGVRFEGGAETSLEGISFQPNIPSEEVFTSPMKGKAEGIVYSAKPLVYNGNVISNFYMKFHEGKVVEVHAETGEETLKSILLLDEGASYLGECAFVPYDSPINNTGLLFYNTLYDENAACHLAIGRGFTELYPNFEKYTEEELHSFGINKSLSHVDFMIGSKDLNVVGTTEDGREVQIFKDGNWAFQL